MARIDGDDEADRLEGSPENDTIDGAGGDDTLTGGAGADSLIGGAGFDEVDYSREAALGGGGGVRVNLAAGTATDAFGRPDRLSGIEAVRGTDGLDTLVGGTARFDTSDLTELPILRGLDGSDSLGSNSISDGFIAAYDLDAEYGGLEHISIEFPRFGPSFYVKDGFGNRETVSQNAIVFIGTAGNDAYNDLDSGKSVIFRSNGGNDSFYGGVPSYQDSPVGVFVDLGNRRASDGFGGTDSLTKVTSVIGSSFADVMVGGDLFDRIEVDYRAPKSQAFSGGPGNDTLDGGNGDDTAWYQFDPTGVLVDLAAGTAWDGYGDVDTLIRMEDALGSVYSDTLIGGASDARLNGWLGDDSLVGGGGNDLLRGLDGSDTLIGGPGNDTLTGENLRSDLPIAVPGDDPDTYVAELYPGTVDIAYVHPDEADIVDLTRLLPLLIGYADGANPFLTGHLRLLEGTATGAYPSTLLQVDTDGEGAAADYVTVMELAAVAVEDLTSVNFQGFAPIVRTIGTEAGDMLRGTAVLDLIEGQGGDDHLEGAAGDDTLMGAAGNDTLFGEAGADVLSGEEGDDALIGGAQADTLTGGQGADAMSGDDGNDRISGDDGDDHLLGGAGADLIEAGAGDDNADGGSEDDSVTGGLGADTLSGGAGADSLAGGDDDDFLFGADGADLLQGGTGSDILVGGVGADTFDGGVDQHWDRFVTQPDGATDIFILGGATTPSSSYDQIEGFEAGIDRIDLRPANVGLLDLTFSDYPGIGVKIVAPGTTGILIIGHSIGDAAADWFLLA